MKLTDRDIKIIEYITEVKGATISQIQLLFFPSYNMCGKRLKILVDNGYLKMKVHPILWKNVYYTKSLPSYHTLVVNEVMLMFRDNIKFYQREYKIGKYAVDGLIILNNNKILVIEVDIYNRTTSKKLLEVYNELLKTNTEVKIIIVSRNKRKLTKSEQVFVTNVGINEIENLEHLV